jgi:hypothetical protein
MIKAKRIRWAVHVECMENVHTNILQEKLKERGHHGDLGIGGGVIMKWIIKE